MSRRSKRQKQQSRRGAEKKSRTPRVFRPIFERLEERCLLSAHGLNELGSGVGDDQQLSPLIVELVSGPNDLTLRRDGEHVQLVETDSGIEVASQPIAATSEIVIWGVDDVDDTLTLEISGGEWTLPVTFHGGEAGFDTLVIGDGEYSTISYSPTSADSGTINLAGTIVTYTGLEPVSQTGTAAEVVFSANPVDQAVEIIVRNSPTAGRISIEVVDIATGAAAAELHDIANPSESLTIRGSSGNDRIILDSLDPAFNANVRIEGGDGNDTLFVRLDPSEVNPGIGTTVELFGGDGTDTLYDLTGIAVGFLNSIEVDAGGLLNWTEQGPGLIQPVPGFTARTQPNAGAIESIATHPFNANIIYVGSVNGGVWLSEDAGTTWRPLTDLLPSLSIGSVAIAPRDADGATLTADYQGGGNPTGK